MTRFSRTAGGAGSPPAAQAGTVLAQRRLTFSRGEDVELPVLGAAYMQLVPHAQANEVESETYQEMEDRKLAPNTLNALTYDLERQVRTLARAVRDPADHGMPLGTMQEWSSLDDDVIMACYLIYADLRERLDPVGLSTLSPDDLNDIRVAIEKKNAMALQRYGVARLSLYLLITAAQPSSSPTPSSSTGASSPE